MLHEPLRAVGRQSTLLHAVQHGGVSCMGVTNPSRMCRKVVSRKQSGALLTSSSAGEMPGGVHSRQQRRCVLELGNALPDAGAGLRCFPPFLGPLGISLSRVR